MTTDDKTLSVVTRLFSQGERRSDDNTTEADKTLSVVKSKGSFGGRLDDDKTSPPLRGGSVVVVSPLVGRPSNSSSLGRAGTHPQPSRMFHPRQVATTNPAPTGGKGFVVVAGLAERCAP
jgi:hypothetical protein